MQFWYVSLWGKPTLNSHADVISGASLKFGLNLYLHSYFEYANSEGSGEESAHLNKLA